MVNWIVYPAAAVQGVGIAIMLNTATSLISDVIGKDEESSAFVYGAYSFFDKIANGGIIFVITAFFNQDETALRWIIGLTPPICAALSYGLTLIGSALYAGRLAKLSLVNTRVN
jgi:MFS family permease